MAGAEWYYSDGGERRGPVEEAALRRLLQTGEADGATLVWRDGMAGWEPAERHFPDLVPPPLPPGARASAPPAPAGRDYAERVGMGEAFRRYWRGFLDFRGRSNRGEYWWAILAVILVSFAIGAVEAALGYRDGGPLSSLWSLATFVPTLSLSVRRLHDIDRTGWWVVVPGGLVALGLGLMVVWFVSGGDPVGAAAVFLAAGITAILLLVWACQRGTPGPNRFG